MGRNTADTQSSGSPASGSTQTRSEDIFTDRAFAFALKHATVYQTRDGNKVKENDPKEHTTVALWEDLYNKVFLRGYSNNSQWYPINQTKKQMDICTFYYADTVAGFRKISLIFTEGKRANNATSTKPGETLYDLEIQLGDYCKQWLGAKRPDGAEDQLYANAVCGPYIRCFLVSLAPNGSVIMRDCVSDELGRVRDVKKEAYLDVRKIEDQRTLHEHFKTIRKAHPATSDRPNSSGGSNGGGSSRPGSSAGSNGADVPRPGSSLASNGEASASRPGSAGNSTGGGRPGTAGSGSQHTGRSWSPMSVDKNGSATDSPPRRSGAGTTATPAERRSASPRDQANMPIRHRSPQN